MIDKNIHITDDHLIEELKRRFQLANKNLVNIKELNRELVQVNEKLTESEKLKSHFISNITNEIVNPFASIVNLAKNLMWVDKNKEMDVKKIAGLIYLESFRLDFQLKNIFMAAKIEAGEAVRSVQKVEIIKLIRDIIETYEIEAQKKKLSIGLYLESNDFEEDSLYKIDAEKIKLILINLIDNAIKFSNCEGEIKVIIRGTNQEISIDVNDCGQGIDKDKLELIFDRFSRLDDGINSINRGHGLGLSVVKSLVTLLDGSVEVDTGEGIGTSFIISIPQSDENVDDFSSFGNDTFFDGADLF